MDEDYDDDDYSEKRKLLDRGNKDEDETTDQGFTNLGFDVLEETRKTSTHFKPSIEELEEETSFSEGQDDSIITEVEGGQRTRLNEGRREDMKKIWPLMNNDVELKEIGGQTKAKLFWQSDDEYKNIFNKNGSSKKKLQANLD